MCIRDRHSETTYESEGDLADRRVTVYTAHFGPWPNVVAEWKARPWSVKIPDELGAAFQDPENPNLLHRG
eukprot:7000373-Alexandrium_andersonii.AAC.1